MYMNSPSILPHFVLLLCSGMLVQDPLKGGYDVDAIFEQARQMGAMQGPFQPQSSSSRSFTGTGRLFYR